MTLHEKKAYKKTVLKMCNKSTSFMESFDHNNDGWMKKTTDESRVLRDDIRH